MLEPIEKKLQFFFGGNMASWDLAPHHNTPQKKKTHK